MTTFSRGGLTLLCAVLMGCAGPQVQPVTGTTGRLQFEGYSILPPPGDGWEMVRGDTGVAFRKELESQSHTLAAAVGMHTGFDPASVGYPEYAKDPQVFAAYAKAATEHANPPDGRLRIIAYEGAADSRFGYCVRESIRFEDRDAPALPAMTLLQQDVSYVCLHPGRPHTIVQVVFSERGTIVDADPTIAEARETFFAAFELEKVSTQGPAVGAPVTATGPVAPATELGKVPSASAQGAGAEEIGDSAPSTVLFVVDASLQEAVRDAAANARPPLAFGFAGDAPAGEPHRRIELSFSSSVDESGQRRNKDGSVIGGPVTMILGAITPWACPVTHTLDAMVREADGRELRAYHLQRQEKQIGTMVACRDVTQPGESVVVELVSELLENIAENGVLASPPGTN